MTVSSAGRSFQTTAGQTTTDRQGRRVSSETGGFNRRVGPAAESQDRFSSLRFSSLIEKPTRTRNPDRAGDDEGFAHPGTGEVAAAGGAVWLHHASEQSAELGIAPPARPALPISPGQRLFVSEGSAAPEVRIQVGAGPLAGTEVRLTRVGAALDIQVAAAGSMSDRVAVERAIAAVRDRLKRREPERPPRQLHQAASPDELELVRRAAYERWSPGS